MKKTETPMSEPAGQLFVTPLEKVLPDSMLPYAEFVIMDRALPRVEDGLKPVQRRILYTMYEMGLTPDKPHKKSARIVGDCMGKYHPHGDSSVYDAMVRMAQDFNMGMTLVNGHGNFGSVDDDPAAAMRYTEARLEPLALELLRDIDKETVPFSLNFDDSLQEPDMLPGRFPNLLVNGATGIAVGLATNIPPHNLGEVIDGVIAYIGDPDISLKELMKYIPAPDFPTGGVMIPGELEQAYETGKGKITLRGKVTIAFADDKHPASDAEKVKRLIIITELPYQVIKSKLLQRIAELQEKPEFSAITRVVDESDRTGMRAVVEMVGSKEDATKLLEALYANTDLQTNFNMNMVAIANGKPQQMGLLAIIKYYVEYQRQVVLRRTEYDLAQAKERCHILEGLIIAVRNIDEVIKIIKKAESTADAREKLRARFQLSERQAQAILDLRLARLTKLEVFKLEEELKDLKAKIEKWTAIVNSTKLQLEVVRDELLDIKKRYAVPRRTRIPEEGEAFAEREDIPAVSDPAYAALTAEGRLICMKKRAHFMPAVPKKKDDIALVQWEVKTNEDLLVFTSKGNCCLVGVKDCLTDVRGRGKTLSELVEGSEPDETIVTFFPEGYKEAVKELSGAMAYSAAADAIRMGQTHTSLPLLLNEIKTRRAAFMGNFREQEAVLLFATARGVLCRREMEGLYPKQRRELVPVIKLSAGDRLLTAELDPMWEEYFVFFVTRKGMGSKMKLADVPVHRSASQGVKGMKLKEGDEVFWAGMVGDEGEIVLGRTDKRYIRVFVPQINAINRDTVGVKLFSAEGEVFFADYVTMPYSLAVFTDHGVEMISTEDVPTVYPKRGHLPALYGWEVKEIFSRKYDDES